MLIPETDSKWSVGGVTDANGLCRLRTHGQFDGAPEGKYKIVVIKDIMEIPEPDTNAPVSIGMDGLPSALGVLYALVDAQFSNVNTTPLTVTITRSGAEPSTFDLGAPVRIRQ